MKFNKIFKVILLFVFAVYLTGCSGKPVLLIVLILSSMLIKKVKEEQFLVRLVDYNYYCLFQ